jgi:hypothetical protein
MGKRSSKLSLSFASSTAFGLGKHEQKALHGLLRQFLELLDCW